LPFLAYLIDDAAALALCASIESLAFWAANACELVIVGMGGCEAWEGEQDEAG